MSGKVSQIIVATRIHLDKATTPPSNLQALVENLGQICAECSRNNVQTLGVIAVDATERISGYNLVNAVQLACNTYQENVTSHSRDSHATPVPLTVLPVQPWGKFAPALNALVSWAAATNSVQKTVGNTSLLVDAPDESVPVILFCSAETTVSPSAIAYLCTHLQPDTLVCGAVLPGHDYQGSGSLLVNGDATMVATELNGRTTPWNTLALWNVSKLALTGFQLVSEGLHSKDLASAGVEEVVAIAVLQRVLGPDNAKAKLINLVAADDQTTEESAAASPPPNSAAQATVDWNPVFSDPSRQEWHEKKMKSKLERASKQMRLLGLDGVVYHC
jgi:hypothetical protein